MRARLYAPTSRDVNSFKARLMSPEEFTISFASSRTMTSLSEVVMKAQPFLLSSSRISSAFAMSPLWARATSVRRLHDDRLGVLQDAGARRRIAHMADAGVPAEFHDVLFREDLVDQAHAALRPHLAVVHREARGLLAAVLEDPQAVVQVRRHGRRARAADDAALLTWAVVGGPRRSLRDGHRQCLFAQE